MFNYLDYKNKIPLEKCVIDIPKINPLSINYEKFWINTIKRKVIEGHWVEHNKEYKWLPGPVFYYCNLGRIERKSKSAGSKGKVIGKPDLRDLEWIKGYIHAVARGFSGFENDTKYSCHRILIHPDRDELINYLPTKVKNSLYTVDGDLKEYKEPLPYLYEYFEENLGKPYYYNTAKNILEIGARNYGKSLWSANICIHNFITDGAVDFDEWYDNYKKSKDDPDKITFTTQTLLGAIDAKYVNNLTHHIKVGLENMPGSMQVADKLYPPPLSKTYMGSWMVGKNITARYQSKVGGKWEWRGTGSSFAMRSFNDNPYAANGLRYGLGLIDEVGFHYNLLETLGQLHECTTVDGEKYGSIWCTGTGGDMASGACVCEGTKIYLKDGSFKNVEDLTKDDIVLGYDLDNKEISFENIPWIQSPSKKECVRITTHTGKVLECSIDHPILFSKWSNFRTSKSYGKDIDGNRIRKYKKKVEFREAGLLNVGEQVSVPRYIDVWGNKTVEDSRLLGISIGDGSYSKKKNNSIIISNCDYHINNWLLRKYKATSLLERRCKDGQLYQELYIPKSGKIIIDNGLEYQSGINKRFPEDIFTWNKKSVCEIIGGYFDADGSVVNNKIEITSIVPELLETLMILLNKLGIHGRIRKKKTSKTKIINNKEVHLNQLYVLNIDDKISINNFYKNIEFISKKKQRRLIETVKHFKSIKENKANNFKDIVFDRIVSIEKLGLKDIYNFEAGNTHTYLANGIITHNTEQAMKVFYDGEAFDCITFDDVFENKGQIGLFIPAWMTLSEFRDELGNINKELAMKKLLKEREVAANAKTKDALYSLLQMKPLVPSEAFLVLEGNIFPIGELKEHLAYLETNEKFKDLGNNGWMYRDDAGKAYFKVDLTLTPATYPTKESVDPKSAVVIWEEPISNPPYGAYIIGVDPYDQDKAENSVSYGSCFVYKRFISSDQTYHIPVAEYTGRPDFADDFYEQVRRLAEYYNAKVLFENQNTGIKKYFETKRCNYLLHTQPNIIKSISPSSNVNRQYGIHMSKPIKDELEIMTRDWLKTELEPGVMQLTKICSIPLLKELIAYDGERNTDRVIAFMLTILQDAEMHLIRVAEKKEIKRDDFFKKQLFI